MQEGLITDNFKTDASFADEQQRWPITRVVRLLVLVDMLSVFLLVPLLPSYFKDLNISTELYGLMTSAYSLAQVVGGVVLGALSDRVMSRRSVLLLSFMGSCVSYGLVGLSSSLSMLLLGRIIVGLVKQTMTISTAIVSECTTAENRSKEISRLTASMTFAFIVGPSLGSLMYQYSKTLPPMVSSSLFLLNSVLVILLLPCDKHGHVATATAAGKSKKTDGESEGHNGNGSSTNSSTIVEKVSDGICGRGDDAGRGGDGQSAWGRFTENLKQTCSDPSILRILAARLIYGFFMRSLGRNNFPGYFEQRFGVETWMQGYAQSYGAGLGFVVQQYAVGPILSQASETTVVGYALATVTLANLAEATSSVVGLRAYLALVVPAGVVANAIIGACLASIFTQRVPQSDLGAALGTLNVLLSASGVVGPLYGGGIMGRLGLLQRPAVTAAHYAAFCVLWWVMEVRGGGRKRAVMKGQGWRAWGGVWSRGKERKD